MVNGDVQSQEHVCPDVFHMLQHMEEIKRAYGNERGYQGLSEIYQSLLGRSFQSKELADMVYQTAGLALSSGDKFFVTPMIGDLIDVAAQKLGDNVMLKPALFPATSGFCWLAKPNPRVSRVGELRGMSWVGTVHADDSRPASTIELPVKDMDAVIFHFWVRLEGFPRLAPAPMGAFKLPMHELVTRERVETSETGSETTFAKFQLAVAFLHFINQRILELHPEPVPRAASKRLQLPDTPHARRVNVVQLRRTQYADTPTSEPRSVDWSCRWLVRGHWRNQYYRKGNVHKLVWINPYTKGPEDKPLREHAQLYQVAK